MASIIKRAGGYQAQLCVNGVRRSATHRTKREAEIWAIETEQEIKEESVSGKSHTLAEALERYRDEVSPTKAGKRWEVVRLNAFLKNPDLPIEKKIGEVTPEDIGTWRDARLYKVSPGSVLREIGLLSSVLTTARREWRWIKSNPAMDVRKPAPPDPRETLITPQQTRSMLAVMRYKRGQCRSVTHAVCHAFLFALRTGMRAGEICALQWDDVFDGYVKVAGRSAGGRKTSAAKRDVPTVYQSRRLIEAMRGFDPLYVFGVESASLDALFRKFRDRAGLEGFTFHDTRHVAATKLAQKVDVLTLCKIMGWTNPKQAMVYYNPKAADITKQLERRPLR